MKPGIRIIASVLALLLAAGVAFAQADVQEEPQGLPEEGKVMTKVDSILAYARTFIGTPYQWAASGPATFDCSGFVKYVFNHFGIEMPRTSTNMSLKYPRVENYADLRPGDLIFFG